MIQMNEKERKSESIPMKYQNARNEYEDKMKFWSEIEKTGSERKQRKTE